jgi:hypothetical protein
MPTTANPSQPLTRPDAKAFLTTAGYDRATAVVVLAQMDRLEIAYTPRQLRDWARTTINRQQTCR